MVTSAKSFPVAITGDTAIAIVSLWNFKPNKGLLKKKVVLPELEHGKYFVEKHYHERDQGSNDDQRSDGNDQIEQTWQDVDNGVD